ncbi:MAG: DNA polymerase III subunit delta [Chloroflexota bacterium]|nr:DNA polymerase III subunit delta [Chloroflexota bacterium]
MGDETRNSVLSPQSSVLHLVHGDDAKATREIVAQLQAAHAETDPSGLNTTILDGDAATVSAVIAASDALPFFGSGRFVLVRGLLGRYLQPAEGQRGRRKATDLDALLPLATFLSAMPATTTLVFWESGTLNLSTLPAPVREALLAGMVHTAGLPAANERDAWLRWIRDRAVTEGVKIERPAAEALLNALGASATGPTGALRLESEIAKLATYAFALDEGGTITAAHVATLVAEAANEQTFAWLDAVIGGNAREAVTRTEQLLAAGEEPMRLLALLASQAGYLTRAKRLGTVPQNDAASLLGVAPNRAYHLLRAARGVDADRMATAMHDLVAADEAVKMGVATSDADALLWAVLQVARLGPPGPAWDHRTDLP